MNPLEERLNRLETRVTRYRNFNVLLCLLLVTVVTVAARDGVSPFQAKSTRKSVAMPQNDLGVHDLPDGKIPEVLGPDANFAGKVPAQVEETIRTRRLEIVNGDGQTAVLLATSTKGGGLIFVNSAEDKNLIYLGSDSDGGDGLINIRNRHAERLIGLFADETPGIHINKTGDENLAYLGANTMDNGIMSLRNNSGKRLVAMQANENSGNIWLFNSTDKRIAYLGTDTGGEGMLEINSKTGTELLTLGSNSADNGLIRVSNSYGILGVAIVAGNEHGIVRTKDAQDRTLAELTATQAGTGLVRTLSPDGITTWQSDFVQGNTGATSLKGDMDNDGDIDGDDFLIFSENFGKKE